jgi:hypothetical protein
MKKAASEHTFGNKDICRATILKKEKFECRLTRKMHDWDFPAWEVRITKGSSRGWITHVRESELELLEAYSHDNAQSSRHNYR